MYIISGVMIQLVFRSSRCRAALVIMSLCAVSLCIFNHDIPSLEKLFLIRALDFGIFLFTRQFRVRCFFTWGKVFSTLF
jgi:hypothetical protein